jgi:hypothetical protein
MVGGLVGWWVGGGLDGLGGGRTLDVAMLRHRQVGYILPD